LTTFFPPIEVLDIIQSRSSSDTNLGALMLLLLLLVVVVVVVVVEEGRRCAFRSISAVVASFLIR